MTPAPVYSLPIRPPIGDEKSPPLRIAALGASYRVKDVLSAPLLKTEQAHHFAVNAEIRRGWGVLQCLRMFSDTVEWLQHLVDGQSFYSPYIWIPNVTVQTSTIIQKEGTTTASMTLQAELGAEYSRESSFQVTPTSEVATDLRILQVTIVHERPDQRRTPDRGVVLSRRDSTPSGWDKEVLRARYLAMISACGSFLFGLFRMLYDKWKVVNWIERPHTSLLHRMDELATLAAKESYYYHQGNSSWKGRLGCYRESKKKNPVQQKDRGNNMNNMGPCELTLEVRSKNGQVVEEGSAGPSSATHLISPSSAGLLSTTTPVISSAGPENNCGRGDSGLEPTRETGQTTPRCGSDKKIQAKEEWRRAAGRFYAFLASGVKGIKGLLWKAEVEP
ncbi:hypothetical protein CLAIMM_08095 [Cladophialophora immunda]|nr:hypothetical protein CLAIMM_08095 [Cladophialophora immunda]